MVDADRLRSHHRLRGSICAAVVLLVWDLGLTGSYVASFDICPIWFVASVVKSIVQRPGWRLALLRIAIPVLTLALAIANNAVQLTVAETNAPRIVAACNEYNAANGAFPKTLDELVPRYLPSVPPAKHCLGPWGKFQYFNYEKPMLVWYVLPPFHRKIYDFETRRWGDIE